MTAFRWATSKRMEKNLAAALLCLVVTGCTSRYASVEGDGTYDGQPIEIGRILFEPEDSKAPKRGGRFEKGHYVLTPPDAPTPGNHLVRISWLKPTGQTYRNEFGD